MDTRDAGRKGGHLSGEARLAKGREAVLACKTARELLAVVMDLERKAWLRGYQAGKVKRKKDAMQREGWAAALVAMRVAS